MSTNGATAATIDQKKHHFDMKKREAYLNLLMCLQTKDSASCRGCIGCRSSFGVQLFRIRIHSPPAIERGERAQTRSERKEWSNFRDFGGRENLGNCVVRRTMANAPIYGSPEIRPGRNGSQCPALDGPGRAFCESWAAPCRRPSARLCACGRLDSVPRALRRPAALLVGT